MSSFLNPFWASVFKWSTISAAVFGGIGVVSAFVSAWVGYQISDATQKDANLRIEEARGDAAKANEKAAGLQKEAAAARLETERLKGVVQWRALSTEEASLLENVLSEAPGSVNLRYVDGDPESLFLAIQFSHILEKAHWRVAPGATKLANAIVFGIALPDKDGGDAQTLRKAFSAAKLSFSTNSIPEGIQFLVSSISGAPTLFIGSRTPPQFP
jgi:hypothetical protein